MRVKAQSTLNAGGRVVPHDICTAASASGNQQDQEHEHRSAWSIYTHWMLTSIKLTSLQNGHARYLIEYKRVVVSPGRRWATVP